MTVSNDALKNPHLRLAILILAAGEGVRLGGQPKGLLRKGGVTLLRRLIESTQDLNPVEILVVTGFYSNALEEEIQSINLNVQIPMGFVRNSNPQAGQSSSVRLGLESLTSDYDALIIALCDQPLVGTTEIESLLDQFQQRSASEEIVLPIVNGQRGNPVIFSRCVINQILDFSGMVCRKYMDLHPELVRSFATDNEAYVLDVDTLKDIQSLKMDGIDPFKSD